MGVHLISSRAGRTQVLPYLDSRRFQESFDMDSRVGQKRVIREDSLALGLSFILAQRLILKNYPLGQKE